MRIDVFEDDLYWITRDTGAVYKQNKFGVGEKSLIVNKFGVSNDLKIYQKYYYNTSIDSPCGRNKCSHLCLITPNGKACACPEGSSWSESDPTRHQCNAALVLLKAPPLRCRCQNGGRCVEQSKDNVGVIM